MSNKTKFDDDLISSAFLDLYKNGDCTLLDDLSSKEDIDLLEQRNFELCHNRRRRAARVRQKIRDLILDGNGLFLTLTFRDEVLNSTTVETRRRYVSRFLKSFGFYVANIDFGEKNGREHYHAVVDKRVDCSLWTYGAINFEKIRCSKASNYRVPKYLTKLTSHAIKESTGHAYRVMYSRVV